METDSQQVETPTGDAPPVEAPTPEPEESAAEGADAVLLRGADLLSPLEASQLAATGNTRLVIWAGERDSGKTTLSAELYERHRNGAARTAFAGSSTLLGFEERIHPARADSERLTPRTLRTEADPEQRELLHLAIRYGEYVTHLLLADIPGELFRRIRDHELSPVDIRLLSHADKLAVLVDGARIADPSTRATAISFARQLIDELAEGDLPGEKMDVALLLTKLDLVLAADSTALAYWEQGEPSLLEAIRQISSQARALRTAARGLEDGPNGMEELMDWLLAAPPDPPEDQLSPADVPPARIQRIRHPRTAP